MRTRLVAVAFVSTLLLLPLSVIDWASLHDIWWDYASVYAIRRFADHGEESWPEWTRTAGEWDRVMWSLHLRTALLLGNAVLLGIVLRDERRRAAADLRR